MQSQKLCYAKKKKKNWRWDPPWTPSCYFPLFTLLTTHDLSLSLRGIGIAREGGVTHSPLILTFVGSEWRLACCERSQLTNMGSAGLVAMSPNIKSKPWVCHWWEAQDLKKPKKHALLQFCGNYCISLMQYIKGILSDFVKLFYDKK